jgi:DNA-binding CsgD family transcriptional regulator
MVTIEEYSRIVSTVHSAAITPEHWFDAMALIRHTFGATSGAVIVNDGAGRTIKCASLSPDAMLAYGDYYHAVDYVIDTVESSPVGLTRGGAELVALNTRSEFYADWLRPNHMEDGLFVRLTDDAQPMCFLVAAPRGRDDFSTADRRAVVDALVPHLQQALRCQAYLTDLVMLAEDLAQAIDGMRHPTIVVGPEGAALHVNSAATAILAHADGLYLAHGRLNAGHAAGAAELRRGIGRALGEVDGTRSGSSFLCQRRSGQRPYVVHVTPFSAGEQRSPRALVIVIDPDADREPPSALLRGLFELTDAEVTVALRVSRGHGLQTIADELSVTLATVKTHLQHVFAKTATHRQAELVRLMLSLTP